MLTRLWHGLFGHPPDRVRDSIVSDDRFCTDCGARWADG